MKVTCRLQMRSPNRMMKRAPTAYPGPKCSSTWQPVPRCFTPPPAQHLRIWWSTGPECTACGATGVVERYTSSLPTMDDVTLCTAFDLDPVLETDCKFPPALVKQEARRRSIHEAY